MTVKVPYSLDPGSVVVLRLVNWVASIISLRVSDATRVIVVYIPQLTTPDPRSN